MSRIPRFIGRSGAAGVDKPAWRKWTGTLATEVSPCARVRLFCFPYAGSGASVYRKWPTAFLPEIDVCPIQLPGRDDRWDEPAIEKMSVLVEMMASALHPLLNLPFALFGHSMGALVAFELAREFRRQTGETALHLFVSGARAPQLPDPEPPLSDLPDAAFLQRLKALNGFPKEILDNQEFLELILPTIRADVRLCDDYCLSPGPPLDCPISAYGGLQDDRAPLAQMALWKAQTTGRFRLRFFPGDHFFFNSARERVLSTLIEDLMHSLALMRTI